ncbi:MAG: tetratricopeptide repeat protein, partial [Actinomycetota bacterium]
MEQPRNRSRLNADARQVMTRLYGRLLEVGLWRHIESVGGSWKRAASGAYFITRDNQAFFDDLLASGGFCRDTGTGGALHRGALSVREISDQDGLHLTLEDDNRIYVHIDRHSPADGARPGGWCSYRRDLARAHLRREVLPLLMGLARGAADDTGPAAIRRRLKEAQESLRSSIRSGDEKESAEAAFGLAKLLEGLQDEKGARKAYEHAAASRDSRIAAAASYAMGEYLEKVSDPQGAESAYRRAAGLDHPQYSPWAVSSLAALKEKLGETEQAAALYREAYETGHYEISPWSAVKLGGLLAASGDAEEAEKAYCLAVDSGHPEFSPWAMMDLGSFLQKRGDPRARAWFEKAVASRHPDAGAWGAVKLGELLVQSELPDEAREAFAKAVAMEHPDVSPWAHLGLG